MSNAKIYSFLRVASGVSGGILLILSPRFDKKHLRVLMMMTVPDELWVKFERYLTAASVAAGEWNAYKKWLRFYLDFCHEYKHEYADARSIEPFLEILKSKRRRLASREQAGKAVALYLQMVGDADATRRGSSKAEQVPAENRGTA
jgi:hypothetical protein